MGAAQERADQAGAVQGREPDARPAQAGEAEARERDAPEGEARQAEARGAHGVALWLASRRAEVEQEQGGVEDGLIALEAGVDGDVVICAGAGAESAAEGAGEIHLEAGRIGGSRRIGLRAQLGQVGTQRRGASPGRATPLGPAGALGGGLRGGMCGRDGHGNRVVCLPMGGGTQVRARGRAVEPRSLRRRHQGMRHRGTRPCAPARAYPPVSSSTPSSTAAIPASLRGVTTSPRNTNASSAPTAGAKAKAIGLTRETSPRLRAA